MQLKIIFLFILLLCSNISFAENTIQNDLFFKNFYMTGSSYIHLAKDGTYRRINREHMFVQESDSGVWESKSNDEIILISKHHFSDIISGMLEIWVSNDELFNDLPTLKIKIDNFLIKNKNKNNFSQKKIEKIHGKNYGENNYISSISINSCDEKIKIYRDDLINISKAISDYISSKDYHKFYLKLGKYKGYEFIVFKNSETPLNRNEEEIKKSIDDLKKMKAQIFFILKLMKKHFLTKQKKRKNLFFIPK